MTDPNTKQYDAQQVTLGANFHTDRFLLSIMRGTRKGEAWHLVGLTRKQLRELGRDIAEVLAEAQQYERAAAARSEQAGILAGFDTDGLT